MHQQTQIILHHLRIFFGRPIRFFSALENLRNCSQFCNSFSSGAGYRSFVILIKRGNKMKKSKQNILTNGQHRIKCSHCGNENEKFYLVSAGLPKPMNKFPTIIDENENRIAEQQKNLAHIFEAQRRFGE